MTTSAHDPFSATFDSIEIDPSRTPSLSAIEQAFAVMAPSAAEPELETAGFYLVDDADGRFEIDRDMGIISLRDESLLETERLTIHVVRMRVIERSGANYEMEMKLRLTGRVPQMVGAEEFAILASMADGLAEQIASDVVAVATPAPQVSAAPAPTIAWSQFSAACAKPGKGALPEQNFVTPLPSANPRLEDAGLSMPEMTLAPASPDAEWSL